MLRVDSHIPCCPPPAQAHLDVLRSRSCSSSWCPSAASHCLPTCPPSSLAPGTATDHRFAGGGTQVDGHKPDDDAIGRWVAGGGSTDPGGAASAAWRQSKGGGEGRVCRKACGQRHNCTRSFWQGSWRVGPRRMTVVYITVRLVQCSPTLETLAARPVGPRSDRPRMRLLGWRVGGGGGGGGG